MNIIECKVESNKTICNCTYSCEKKGLCCECLNYHRDRSELPACYFPDDIECNYNRSINRFIEVYKKRHHL